MNKLHFFILLVGLFLVKSANAQRITLDVDDASLETVFEKIAQQSPYRFVYTSEELIGTRKVSLSVLKVPIATVLGLLFKSQPIDFSVEENYIYIRKKQDTTKGYISIQSGITVRGKVTDSVGNPLAGASVQLKGFAHGTQTSIVGTFTLSGVRSGDLIEISYTGFLRKILKIEHQDFVNIVLVRSTDPLDEVQIIGYGSTTQRRSTGNTVKIDSKSISEEPVENPLTSIAGRAPGVFVQSSSGLPGSKITVQIRGLQSIASGTNPLYIVDGVPFSAYSLNNSSSTAASLVLANFQVAAGDLSPFNLINPGDIESIEILKDADATAIYGSRGSNGVILITTRKGKTGKTQIDVNLFHGWQHVTHVVKTVNTTQFLEIDREAYANDGIPPTPELAPEILAWDTTESINYQKQILGNESSITNAQLSLSGGNVNTRFLFTGNYLTEGTVLPGDFGYSRAGGHLNVEHNSSDQKFSSSFTVTYNVDQNKISAQSLGSINYFPDYPLYDSTGQLNWAYENYLGMIRQVTKTTTENLFTSGNLSYSILSPLKVLVNLGYNRIFLSGTTVFPLTSFNPNFGSPNAADYASNGSSTYILEPQVVYSLHANKHSFLLTAGSTYEYQYTQGSFIEGQNYSNEALFQNIGAAGNIAAYPPPTSNYTQYKYSSIFGRVTYSYKDRYLLNTSLRRDGSSRFGPGARFGNFYALGAGWVFSNEDFVKNQANWLSFGKLRGSYGSVGNDQIADYQYLATYSTSGSYQGSSSLQPSRIANPNYSWEITKKAEIGIELGFLKDAILVNASRFIDKSNNQLVGYPLPTQTGFTSYQYNLPALVENSGFEFSVTTANFKRQTFSWTTTFNISFNKNVLKSYPGLASSSYRNTYVIGKSLTVQKGFAFTKVDPNTGLPLFSTAKGADTTYPSYPTDQVVMGKTLPDFYGGLENKFNFKAFQLDILVQFVKQQGYYPQYWPGIANDNGYMPPEMMNRWQSIGQKTNIPLASTIYYSSTTSNSYYDWIGSSKFWGNTSFIRLKNLALSYSFLPKNLKKANFTKMRVYVEAQNLLTGTKYPGSDPEIPSGTLVVPTLRTVATGIQITF